MSHKNLMIYALLSSEDSQGNKSLHFGRKSENGQHPFYDDGVASLP